MIGSIRRSLWPAASVIVSLACACATGILGGGELDPADFDIQSVYGSPNGSAWAVTLQASRPSTPATEKEQDTSIRLKLDGAPAAPNESDSASDSDSDAADKTDSASPSPSNQLSPEMDALGKQIRAALTMYYPRHQNTRDNTPWEVMHAIIAYGVDTRLFKGGPAGERVNAVGWMCFNNPCAGERMLFVNRDTVDARRGVGVQGHAGQFLAILAQSHVKSDYPLMVSGKNFTLADLIEHEKETCVAGEELTFKLISLMHYLDSDAEWTTRDGQQWSIQRLIREELKQPIRGAACGGTHRLMGFSYAVNKRIQRGKPMVGEFRRAQTFVQDYHRYTFGMQNPDGSFSTEWFTRRGDSQDIDRRLKTSGHILEWIAFSLSDDELRDPRTVKVVDYLSNLLLKNSKHTWEIGPLGHGLHSLAIYHNRVFQNSGPAWLQSLVSGPEEEAVLQATLPVETVRE